MRMRRSITALAGTAALATVCGCTVQAPDAEDGRARPPARPGVAGTASAPAPGTTAPDDKPRAAPTTVAPSPAPAVLWSRGDTGRDVRELQARLRQVAWLFEGPTGTYGPATEQAVRGFQGKRGLPQTGKTDSVTWRRLLGMTREPAQWELYVMGGQPAAAPDARCRTGRVLCIDKTSRTLRWMIDGRTLSTVSVRFGSQYTPTREGVFHVYWKSRDHVSTLYHTPMPYAMFFSGGQAVHYSADFAARGYAGASHGCVNVRDEAAISALFAQVRTGDKVVVSW
ncbi:L,D-transpeptidase family protein [Streptomyces sp. NPDC049687]|uniref:L,D-transpeptidase family protein n=1 Tax=Streptomyces sp. NPDC049687 TaxID=3365596 RepID=UPI0037963353